MIIVTGAAGFIGSKLIQGLNARGRTDILAVDNLSHGEKFTNLSSLEIQDYIDKNDFIDQIDGGRFVDQSIEVIFHEGACSTTTEWDGRYMMHNNYDYSKRLLHFCLETKIPLLYASSASVYGGGNTFREERQYEAPLNVYGYSKLLFDNYIRQQLPQAQSQLAGFRYFNVYGPHEQHKNEQASVVFHLRNQLVENGQISLFDGYDGYEAGEQRRDFIHIDDVVAVNLWFWENPQQSGIFNVGTGQSRSFNDMAKAVLAYYGKGELNYRTFPDHLKGRYQSFTEADITRLRDAGYDAPFKSLEQGINEYLHYLEHQ